MVVDVDQDSSETGDYTIDVVVDEDADAGDRKIQVRIMSVMELHKKNLFCF